MRNRTAAALIAWCLPIIAQNAPKPVLGTVAAFRTDPAAIEVKTRDGATQLLRFGPNTAVQRIAPGEKDLKNAAPIAITDVKLGDRVLVSFVASDEEARRIIVMPAADIAKRDESERKDWAQRGVLGVVVSRKGNELNVRVRAFPMESIVTVAAAANTAVRRYAPDSVKFSDARPAALDEIRPGDQLRARGAKSEDGKRVEAEEIVYGSFDVRGGTVTSVDAANRTVVLKDLIGGKPLTVKLTPDSQVKRMPEMGGGRDLAGTLERLPQAKLEDFAPGETVIVSSTKGARSGEITAIVMLGNAARLIEMASRTGGRREGPEGNANPLAGMPDLPAMLP